eukprot:CAMPEP_0180343672 /NCGR_PEP_ID=MMETSP0989-20121125/2414_1 /TAXON_ID=697907 /ORGANISM="non described non described, Strain CCMP2293" /LENGTH=53 /DNA_ID=CAMNT_0022332651 /DNA_START=159 /DNA_END=320 /DNA_ORIENTATION=+
MALWWSHTVEGGQFFLSEVPLYSTGVPRSTSLHPRVELLGIGPRGGYYPLSGH